MSHGFKQCVVGLLRAHKAWWLISLLLMMVIIVVLIVLGLPSMTSPFVHALV